MATTSVVTTRTGTGFTIDVTNANLSSDLTLKDFVVLKGSPASVDNNANWTKTSRTVLTYGGASLASNTPIEVRRSTPDTPIQVIQYAQRFSSGDFNNEIDRITRRAEEYRLYGSGPGSVLSTATPLDTAFGVSWQGNIVNPPTMNAAYNYIVGLAPLASPTFTGVPVAPTAATVTNTTQIATTQFVQSNLASYATLASPTFSGTPAAPTAIKTVNTTQLATTAMAHLASVVKKITHARASGTYSTTGSFATVVSSSITPRSSTSSFLIFVNSMVYLGDNTSNVYNRIKCGTTVVAENLIYMGQNAAISVPNMTLFGVYTPASSSTFTAAFESKLASGAASTLGDPTVQLPEASASWPNMVIIEFENTL